MFRKQDKMFLNQMQDIPKSDTRYSETRQDVIWFLNILPCFGISCIWFRNILPCFGISCIWFRNTLSCFRTSCGIEILCLDWTSCGIFSDNLVFIWNILSLFGTSWILFCNLYLWSHNFNKVIKQQYIFGILKKLH